MSAIFAPAVSTMLARALAQAASGYVNQGNLYFVARNDPGEDGMFGIVSPLTSLQAAEQEAVRLGPEYGAFGPFDTTVALAIDNPIQLTVSDFEVTDSAGITFPIPGDRYDTLFYSVASVVKFAVPYYTQVYSSEFAQQVLEEFEANELGLMAHLPWSEYVDIDPDIQIDSEQRATCEPAQIPVLFKTDPLTGKYREYPFYPPRMVRSGVAGAVRAATPR
ncbi:MAG TPA: hypothetical protein VFX98_06930 [Longimicrobiaceae bacterium]|nr:hypothetical protein [Longimicrobiaceae bacterium]